MAKEGGLCVKSLDPFSNWCVQLPFAVQIHLGRPHENVLSHQKGRFNSNDTSEPA